MKTIITSGLLFLLILFTSASCDKEQVDNKGDDMLENTTSNETLDPINIDLNETEIGVVKSNEDFAFNFFSQILKEERNGANSNFMVSPFSLSMVLAMTWNGSDGETKLAIQETLGFEDWTEKEVNEYFQKLKDAFEETDPSTDISIANSIWTNQNIKVFPDFISLNEKYYDATVEAVDFANPSTAGKINQWATENTNGLIEEVIDETKPSDLMYLLNALYFKGIWTTEFDAEKTTKMNFIAVDSKENKVDMMYQKSNFNYAEDEVMQLVELPYGNKAFSMMVLLPKKDKQIEAVAQALKDKRYWSSIKSDMQSREVDLFIPKFETEYSKSLNDILIDMGMQSAFDPVDANFARMSDKDAFISLVKQDTYIATDEVGTEAAAVTSVGVTVTSLPADDDKIIFKADRPFIYIIQEKTTGSILFMGAQIK